MIELAQTKKLSTSSKSETKQSATSLCVSLSTQYTKKKLREALCKNYVSMW